MFHNPPPECCSVRVLLSKGTGIMARMIPADGPALTGSRAEYNLYWILKEQLSGDFVVIHSVPWLTDVASRRSSGAPTREVDFLILHPEYGLLAIEVKGGRHDISEIQWITSSPEACAQVRGIWLWMSRKSPATIGLGVLRWMASLISSDQSREGAGV